MPARRWVQPTRCLAASQRGLSQRSPDIPTVPTPREAVAAPPPRHSSTPAWKSGWATRKTRSRVVGHSLPGGRGAQAAQRVRPPAINSGSGSSSSSNVSPPTLPHPCTQAQRPEGIIRRFNQSEAACLHHPPAREAAPPVARSPSTSAARAVNMNARQLPTHHAGVTTSEAHGSAYAAHVPSSARTAPPQS